MTRTLTAERLIEDLTPAERERAAVVEDLLPVVAEHAAEADARGEFPDTSHNEVRLRLPVSKNARNLDAAPAWPVQRYPDHSQPVMCLQFGSDLPVLMTEKDAVKCAAFADARSFMVPVEAMLSEAFWLALLDRLPVRVA